MKNILNNIWKYIKLYFSKLTMKDIIYVIIIFLLLSCVATSVKTCQNNKNQYNINIKALTDTIHRYKTKSGKVIVKKTVYIAKSSEIQYLDKTLYDKIVDTDVKTKNVTSAATFSGEASFGIHDTTYIVKHDTIFMGFFKDFNFDNQWRQLEGNVNYNGDTLTVIINKDIVNFDYTVVVDKDNNLYVKSENPYVTFNELSGFTLPKTKTYHWGFGPSVGIGYDVYRNKISPTIGVSVQYNLFKW